MDPPSAVPAPARPAAKSASTGWANSSASDTSRPKVARSREIICTASSEWPPEGKEIIVATNSLDPQ